MSSIHPYKEIIQAATTEICNSYGLSVAWVEQPEGSTGDLDGTNILVDPNIDAEMALYVLLHLFGHTVQWNVDRELNDIGHSHVSEPNPEKLLHIFEYERNASRLGLSLLQKIGHGELQEWISRWFWADWAFLKHLYETGEHKIIRIDWEGEITQLEPLPIPAFQPHTFEKRQAFD